MKRGIEDGDGHRQRNVLDGRRSLRKPWSASPCDVFEELNAVQSIDVEENFSQDESAKISRWCVRNEGADTTC